MKELGIKPSALVLKLSDLPAGWKEREHGSDIGAEYHATFVHDVGNEAGLVMESSATVFAEPKTAKGQMDELLGVLTAMGGLARCSSRRWGREPLS